MNKVINISSNGIKQAIDDLVNENEMLQDKVYKLENIIKEAREYIKEHIIIDDVYTDCMVMLVEEYDKLLEILDKENK